jgi:hypothetical protein
MTGPHFFILRKRTSPLVAACRLMTFVVATHKAPLKVTCVHKPMLGSLLTVIHCIVSTKCHWSHVTLPCISRHMTPFVVPCCRWTISILEHIYKRYRWVHIYSPFFANIVWLLRKKPPPNPLCMSDPLSPLNFTLTILSCQCQDPYR